MYAVTTSGSAEDIVPGTSAETVLETVCRSDFPDSASMGSYVAVKDNNIAAFAKAFFLLRLRGREEKRAPAATAASLIIGRAIRKDSVAAPGPTAMNRLFVCRGCVGQSMTNKRSAAPVA